MAILKMLPITGVGALFYSLGDTDPVSEDWWFRLALHNGWRSYKSHSTNLFLWHDDAARWWISEVLGETAGGAWESPTAQTYGVYIPTAPFTGNPTIAIHRYAGLRERPGIITETTKHNWILRVPRQRLVRIAPARQAMKDAFARAAVGWKVLPPPQKLIWQGIGDKFLQIREGINIIATGYKRWMQVNTCRILAGLPVVDTLEQFDPITVRVLDFYLAQVPDQDLYLLVSFNAAVNDSIKATIHVSQIPPWAIGRSSAWKFARWIGSSEFIEPVVLTPNPFWANFYPAKFKFKNGETVQLYVRIVLHVNPNPPISDQDSRETTEDWTALTRVGVTPP